MKKENKTKRRSTTENIMVIIKASKKEELKRIYDKAKKLGRRKIPTSADDWISFMRWLEEEIKRK